MSLRDLAQAVTALAVPEHTVAIKLRRPAADADPLKLGATHAGPHSLDDQVPLEFGNGRDNNDHGAAQRAGRV